MTAPRPGDRAVVRRAGRQGWRAGLAVVLAAVGVLAAWGAAPALASWASTASADVSVGSASLTVPPAPSVGSATATSLTVSGTLPTQPAGTAYAVVRGGTTVCTPAGSAYTCTDTGLASGTSYTYTVVASLSSWTATSPASTGATSCATTTLATSAPATATAGTAVTVTLTARRCDGTTDTGVTGSRSLTWAAVAASPSGTAALLPTSASFGSGVAVVQVTPYAAGPATLQASSGALAGTGVTVSVAAATPRNLDLTGVTSKGAAVQLTCGALSVPPAPRTCTASDPQQSGLHSWTATPVLLDTWGNAATAATATTLTVSASGSTSATSQAVVAAGSSSGAPFSVSVPNGGTVTIGVSGTGLQTLTVTGAR